MFPRFAVRVSFLFFSFYFLITLFILRFTKTSLFAYSRSQSSLFFFLFFSKMRPANILQIAALGAIVPGALGAPQGDIDRHCRRGLPEGAGLWKRMGFAISCSITRHSPGSASNPEVARQPASGNGQGIPRANSWPSPSRPLGAGFPPGSPSSPPPLTRQGAFMGSDRFGQDPMSSGSGSSDPSGSFSRQSSMGSPMGQGGAAQSHSLRRDPTGEEGFHDAPDRFDSPNPAAAAAMGGAAGGAAGAAAGAGRQSRLDPLSRCVAGVCRKVADRLDPSGAAAMGAQGQGAGIPGGADEGAAAGGAAPGGRRRFGFSSGLNKMKGRLRNFGQGGGQGAGQMADPNADPNADPAAAAQTQGGRRRFGFSSGLNKMRGRFMNNGQAGGQGADPSAGASDPDAPPQIRRPNRFGFGGFKTSVKAGFSSHGQAPAV